MKTLLSILMLVFLVGCGPVPNQNQSTEKADPQDEWKKLTLYSNNGTVIRQWILKGQRTYHENNTINFQPKGTSKWVYLKGTIVEEPYLEYAEKVNTNETPEPTPEPTREPEEYGGF